jgi:hypothetical protein
MRAASIAEGLLAGSAVAAYPVAMSCRPLILSVPMPPDGRTRYLLHREEFATPRRGWYERDLVRFAADAGLIYLSRYQARAAARCRRFT